MRLGGGAKDRQSLGTTDRARALQLAEALAREVAHLKYAGRVGPLTVGQLATLYRAEVLPALSPARQRGVRGYLALLAQHFPDALLVADLTRPRVDAYAGFRHGLRKTREERGFDRRMAWYEEALTASRAAREAVEHAAAAESLRAGQQAATVAAATTSATDQSDVGDVSVEAVKQYAATAWGVARDRTAEFLRVLDRAVTHADVESEAVAARALIIVRSLSAQMRPDACMVSEGGSSERHPFYPSPPGNAPTLLSAFRLELQYVEQGAIAGARATLGYPPRLPELLPNAQGVIEIPSRDTERTPRMLRLLRRMRLARVQTSKFNV